MLDKIINILAPHHCLGCNDENNLLCAGCRELGFNDNKLHCYKCNIPTFDHIICRGCLGSAPFTEIFAIGSYDELLEKLIYKYKFERAKAAAEPLVELLNGTLPYLPEAIIVPVPTASKRIRQRGYDQVLLLAEKLAKLRSLQIDSHLVRHDQSRQLGAGRRQRLRQAKLAFKVTKPELIKGKTIIVLDDVLTTGATLENAARLLRKAGADRVFGLVIAQQQLDK